MTARVAMSCHLCWMLLVTSSTYEDGTCHTCQLHVPLKCPVGDPGPYVMHGLLPLPIQIFSLLRLYQWVEHLHCNFSNKMTYIHTYPFNGFFSGSTRVSQYQKGKTSWAIWKSAPRSRQITMTAPHHSVFYRPDVLPAAQPTTSKHRRHDMALNILWADLNLA